MSRALTAAVETEFNRLNLLVLETRADRNIARNVLSELYDTGHIIDLHDSECPEDDTCACPMVARFNLALRGLS
jgi:hypothetical protein